MKNNLSLRILLRLPKFIVSDPYEAFFSVALFLTGVTDIVEPRATGAIQKLLPVWETYSWGAVLIIGSALTFIGLVLSSRAKTIDRLQDARITERLGQLLLGVATSLWSFVLFSLGVLAVASGILTLFLAFVFFVKSAVLKRMEEYIVESAMMPDHKEGG